MILTDWKHSGGLPSRQNPPMKFLFFPFIAKIKLMFSSAFTNGQVYCLQYLENAVER